MTTHFQALAAPTPQAAHFCADEACSSCRRTALRLQELEQANDRLRREAELAAQRLQAALEQLAAAQGPDPLATQGGAVPACCGLRGPHLGARERQVLRLLTEGQRTPAIAGRMGITGATVEVHRRNIMRKLGLHSVAQLTKYALREGITSL